jgi:hypothetical protein
MTLAGRTLSATSTMLGVPTPEFVVTRAGLCTAATGLAAVATVGTAATGLAVAAAMVGTTAMGLVVATATVGTAATGLAAATDVATGVETA